MSQRSLVELNHDYGPGSTDEELIAWARKMLFFLNCSDPRELPRGVELKHQRHHSEPSPLEAQKSGPGDQYWREEITRLRKAMTRASSMMGSALEIPSEPVDRDIAAGMSVSDAMRKHGSRR